MKRSLSLMIMAAVTVALAPLSLRFGPLASAGMLVLLAMAMAIAASGWITSPSLAAGAVGAFAWTATVGLSGAVAGALLFGFVYLERTMRIRDRTARAVHLMMALGAGAIAGALPPSLQVDSIAVSLVAAAVCGVLAAAPLLIEADDPVAHALDGLARDIPDPAGQPLRAAAELKRTADDSLVDRAARHTMRDSWKNLIDLANARARLERTPVAAGHSEQRLAIVARLDRRIREHVHALERAFSAADEARAAELSLDDSALRSVETTGESLEQISKALADDPEPAVGQAP
jgi:hypothetical protein